MRVRQLKSIPPKMEVDVDAHDIAELIALAAKLSVDSEVCRNAREIDKFMRAETRSGERTLNIVAHSDRTWLGKGYWWQRMAIMRLGIMRLGNQGYWLGALEQAFKDNPQREIVLQWILEEWNTYATPKFGKVPDRGEHDEAMAREGWAPDGFWLRQVFQYADRSHLFMAHGNPAIGEVDGDETLMLKGKQAALKMATTLIDGLASMTRAFGVPPAPGHTSGDIKDWDVLGESADRG